MPKKKAKRLVDVLDGIDKMEHQYIKVLPKLHKLMNVIRSSELDELITDEGVLFEKEKDYDFVKGVVREIEQNKWNPQKDVLTWCNKLYRRYK